MSVAEPKTAEPKPSIRWYHLTPDRAVIGLLVAECLLWLSERFGWLPWHKGYAVLTGVAVVGVTFVAMLLWLLVSLLFRWRFQFSVRSLLIFAVVVAIPSSWMMVEMEAAKRQQEAVTEILDGNYYTYADSGKLPVALQGLRDVLGEDFFLVVDKVSVGEGSLTDAELECLPAFPELRTLRLSGCFPENTDNGLKSLRGLSKLQLLDLRGERQVTDAGLEHIAGLTQLQELRLNYTQVTNAGLEHLKRLSQLRYLDVRGTQVTDEGVKKLQQALPNCQIDFQGVQPIKQAATPKGMDSNDPFGE
jgi:hypothetical protein